MSSSLSASEEFMLEDSSSSEDNSYLEDILIDDNIEQTMVIIVVNNLHERLQMKMRRGSVIVHLCIPRNRALGHESLIQDYFSKVPTYLPSLSNALTIICQDCSSLRGQLLVLYSPEKHRRHLRV
jgi:hypothetical protein